MSSVRDDRSISLYLSCQPSGGANGSDARSANATNTDRRRTSSKPTRITSTYTRPPAAKRKPGITGGVIQRADVTGTRNPRKPTNPGNHKTRVVSRKRNPTGVRKDTDPRTRPIPGSIY